jgi:hypothetical protein
MARAMAVLHSGYFFLGGGGGDVWFWKEEAMGIARSNHHSELLNLEQAIFNHFKTKDLESRVQVYRTSLLLGRNYGNNDHYNCSDAEAYVQILP